MVEAWPVGSETRSYSVAAIAVLADGRVVSGGSDGRVLVWDPAAPGVGPIELGADSGRVMAVAGLTDGRVASGAQDSLLLWDPDIGERIAEITCSVEALASCPNPSLSASELIVAHTGTGLSGWLVTSTTTVSPTIDTRRDDRFGQWGRSAAIGRSRELKRGVLLATIIDSKAV